MKFKNLIKIMLPLFAFIFALNFLATPSIGLATAPDLGLDKMEGIGLGEQDPRDTVVGLIKLIISFLGTIAVLIVLYGGFLWMTASGNQDQIDKAQKLLIAGVVGLVIILSAFGLATFVLEQLQEATTPQ